MRPHPIYTLPESWETAVGNWTQWLTIGGMSAASVVLRRNNVRMVARCSGTSRPRDVTLADLVRVCSGQTWSLEHRRSVRTSLVQFLDWCARNDLAASNPALQLPTVRNDPGRPRPATEDVWRDLVATAKPRELLMVRLAGEAGMRRGEVALCHRDDLFDDPRGACLIVHGKGNKQRVIPLNEPLAQAIREHCRVGYLFPGQTNGHISAQSVGTLISALMPTGYTMHTLRHFFATRAYRGSRNIRAVQMLLGHASVATTERYTAVDDDELRAAAMSACYGVTR